MLDFILLLIQSHLLSPPPTVGLTGVSQACALGFLSSPRADPHFKALSNSHPLPCAPSPGLALSTLGTVSWPSTVLASRAGH